MFASLKASAANAASAAKGRYNVAAEAKKMVDEVCILFKIVTVRFWVGRCAKHGAPFRGTKAGRHPNAPPDANPADF